ncbi:MAG: hypothetical protein MUC88_18820 [Planctomycetes bacterium]|jgi:hypothetical protein|nr:hypothetical protein [Planctomycetota bacterium]
MVAHACVLAIVIGASTGQISPAVAEKLAAGHCAVAGLTQLAAVVTTPSNDPNAAPVDGEALRIRIAQKLSRAGIKTVDAEAGEVPRLIVRVEGTGVPDGDRCAFRVQIALIRLVILPNLPDVPVPAEVWQARPVLEIIPKAEAPAAIGAAVQSQVDAFLAAHEAARRALEQGQNMPPGMAMSGPASPPTLPACPVVAARDSRIFHRWDCRWAQSIAAGNRIGYKSREEAVQAGKRPCKTCQP